MRLNQNIVIRKAFIYLIHIIILASCSKDSKKEVARTEEASKKAVVAAPDFNEDSAYVYTEKQVAFGPRVPNTIAHKEAGNFFVSKLKSFGAQVITQDFTSQSFDGHELQLRNIIASFSPDKTKRVLLAAHWDSRPFADKDDERQDEAIDAANDGASGVAVLLEVARLINQNPPENVGVDIIFFDGEDWGNDISTQDEVPVSGNIESWWCLGSQYWGKNPHKKNYSAYYGILLDMVGGKDAKFFIEGFSQQTAPSIVKKVWSTASTLGYSNYFVKRNIGAITDDHYFVNKFRGIPIIDIIAHDPENNSFGYFHHTHDDNMSIISKPTLDAVGETVMTVIYNE